MTEIVTTGNMSELEDYIAGHPKGHFMQSHMWSRVKTDWTWEGIISRASDGSIRGAMSVLIRKAPYLPYTIMYAGRGPVCDICDTAVIAELTAGAAELAKKYNSYTLKLDPDVKSDNVEFVNALKGIGFVSCDVGKNFSGIQPKYVFRLYLDGRDEEQVFQSFQSKTRYNIRVAERKGVEVKICGKEALDDFSRLMLDTGVRDGFVVRDRKYFERMLDSLGESARLYMAYLDDKAIAGTLAIGYGDKVWYLYGASANEYRNTMPNYLLQWNMIKWAIERGARVYDFRGVSGDLSEDNPLYGLYRFKRGFNGEFTEFVGEFDLIFHPLVKKTLEKGERVYRRLRKNLFMFKNKK